MYLFSFIIIICIFVLFSKISDLTSKINKLEGLNKHLQKELDRLRELLKGDNTTSRKEPSFTVVNKTSPVAAPVNTYYAEQKPLVQEAPINADPKQAHNLDTALEQIEEVVNASPWIDPVKQLISAVTQDPASENVHNEPAQAPLPLQKNKEPSFSTFGFFAKNWIPVSGAAFIFIGLAYALIAANVSVSFFVGLAYFIFTLMFGASVSQKVLDLAFKSHSRESYIQSAAQISAGVSVGLLYLTTFIANTVFDLFSTNTAFILYFMTSAVLFKVSIFSEKPTKALTALGFIGAYLSPILTFKVSGSWSSSLAFNLVYAYALLAFSLYVSLRNRWVEIALLSQTMAGILAGNALIFAHYIGAPLLVKEFGVLAVVATLLAWLIKYTKTHVNSGVKGEIEKLSVYFTTTLAVLLSVVATGLVINHPVERVFGAFATILIFGLSVWAAKEIKQLGSVLKSCAAITFAGLVAVNNSFVPSELGLILIFLEGLLILRLAEPASFLKTKLTWPLCMLPILTLLTIASPLTAFTMFVFLSLIIFGADKLKLSVSPIFQAICSVASLLFLGLLFYGFHQGLTLVVAALISWAFVLHASDRKFSRHSVQRYLHFVLFWLVSFLPLLISGPNIDFAKFAAIVGIQYVALLGYHRIEKFPYSPHLFLGLLTGSLIGYGFVSNSSIFILLVCSAFFLGSSYFFGRVNLLMLDKSKSDEPIGVVNIINRSVIAACAVKILASSQTLNLSFSEISLLFFLGAFSLYYETYKIETKPFVKSLKLYDFKWHISLFAGITWFAVLSIGAIPLLIKSSVSVQTILLPFIISYTILMCSALRIASLTKNVPMWLSIAAALGVNILVMIALIKGLSNNLHIGIPFLIIGFALLWAGFVAPKPVSNTK